MEIKKTVSVRLSPSDVKAIIIEHLLNKGIKVNMKDVYFRVGGHEAEGDFFSQYPLDYRLDEVLCEGIEK
jgi:hypothetical protein